MPRLRDPVIVAAYLALYMTADMAAAAHLFADLLAHPWNAAPAISFAIAVRHGRKWLWFAFVAPLLAGLIDGGFLAAPLSAILRAAAETAGAALGVILLHPRNSALVCSLKRRRGVFRFLTAACAASALTSIILAIPPFLETNSIEPATLLFLFHLVAILSIAPLVLVYDKSWRHVRFQALLTGEIILQTGALALIAWEVFGRFVNEEIHFFYLLFLPFAWIATRHGQIGAALALGAIYVAPVLTDLLFGHNDTMIVEMQIRLGVLAVTSLLFGAMTAERRDAEMRMLERQTELAHFQRLNVGWEMASALAHELNQPLTAAMNLTQAALRLLKTPSPDIERAANVMSMSVDRVERVGQIIHGLRDFMRKGELTLAANAMSDMADDAIRLVSAEANAAGVAILSSGMSALPEVMADKTQIVQVLINLLRNAIQSLTLSKTPHPQITVAGRIDIDMIEISVADSGPGMPNEVMDHLFEPFVTTKVAGMGLGLSISKSILEAHEGRLWAENAPTGGAIFRFTLPLAKRDLENA
ncbi:putative Two-component sensor histidine kinase [Rhodospirillaceae bacterium LM-1]|nr:putative Two-component sensor histidine kinase [Rhodospirillaceae bacterium LM-1]